MGTLFPSVPKGEQDLESDFYIREIVETPKDIICKLLPPISKDLRNFKRTGFLKIILI